MANKNKYPYLINFSKIGNSEVGYISVAENDKVPFKINRVYWSYYTPDSVIRGHHAHISLEQILIPVSGRIEVICELPDGFKEIYILDKPDQGLFLPKACWHTMKYTHNSVQMCLASLEYNESDYVRNYEDFKKMQC